MSKAAAVVESAPSQKAAPEAFWENGLEFNAAHAEQSLAEAETLREWTDALTGRQVRMLSRLLGMSSEGSVQNVRTELYARPDALHPFFLVQQFAKGKSEIAAVEVARENLDPETVGLCVRGKRVRREEEVAEDRYDKVALLFALYAHDRDLLKQVLHFDKVHKKGFASMVLADVPHKTPKASFETFLTDKVMRGILDAHQHACRDGSVCELQGIWQREGRIYVFIRRTERPDHIHDGRSIVHGFRAEWIVLDFASDGDQVNVASNSVSEPLDVANRVASTYFGVECRFVNEQTMTDAPTIMKFIEATRSGTNGLGIVEACVTNSPLRGAAKVRLSHEDSPSLRESLDHFDDAFGPMMDSLQNIEWIKVLYRGKRVGLQFEQDESGDERYTVRYTDQRLNAFERRRFEQEIRDGHGISVLSTEKR